MLICFVFAKIKAGMLWAYKNIYYFCDTFFL